MNQNLVLDRYRLVERLAVGGSAEVWRARDEQLERDVAVKRLHPHLLPDEASRRRLAVEARAAAALAHPVVVSIYDVDATGEWPALVMELVDGESLAARIARDGPLPQREAVAIAADVADALFHAHRRGVIHRDVKPGNVLLAADGRTRLVDFGIAHSLAAGSQRLTLAGTVIGTLHAMAPEQLSGGAITPRTDLYGLGVVLHEALTGRPPFAETSPVALADAQRAGPRPMPELDPALAAVLLACLAHDPQDRPLHAGALGEALRDWLSGDASAALAMAPPPAADTAAVTQPIPITPPPAPAPIATVAAGVPQAASIRPAVRRERRRWWPVAALLALAMLGVLVSGVLLDSASTGNTGDQPSPSPPSPSAQAMPTPAPIVISDKVRQELAELADKCGAEEAAAVAGEIAGLDERAARDLVKERREQCRPQGGGRDDDDDD